MMEITLSEKDLVAIAELVTKNIQARLETSASIDGFYENLKEKAKKYCDTFASKDQLNFEVKDLLREVVESHVSKRDIASALFEVLQNNKDLAKELNLKMIDVEKQYLNRLIQLRETIENDE